MTTNQRNATARLVGTRQRTNGKRTHLFRASTTSKARDQLEIPADAWDLEPYRRNPVVLASHDMFSLPVGRAVNVTPDMDGLLAEIEFDTDDPKGAEIDRKAREGWLNAVSVSWITHEMEGNRVTHAELLEISVVAVPSDPKALAIRAMRKHTDPQTALVDGVTRLVTHRISGRRQARRRALDDISRTIQQIKRATGKDDNPAREALDYIREQKRKGIRV